MSVVDVPYDTVRSYVSVHPLSLRPDECYTEMKANGRYHKLTICNERDLFTSEKKPNSIRFVCISDTHSKIDKEFVDLIPEGDILIHAGDFTASSTSNEIFQFNEFLSKVMDKFKHIVVIAGNHELSFDEKTQNAMQRKSNVSMYKAYFGNNPQSEQVGSKQAKDLLNNCIYLQDESVVLLGVKIYGSPWQPPHYDLAFNELRGERLLNKWNMIPSDTDVLITHGPPLGIGDLTKRGKYVGCAELLSTVMDRVKPNFHVFGHIHEGHGVWTDGTTTFVNAAICDERYNPVNKPVVLDFMLTHV